MYITHYFIDTETHLAVKRPLVNTDNVMEPPIPGIETKLLTEKSDGTKIFFSIVPDDTNIAGYSDVKAYSEPAWYELMGEYLFEHKEKKNQQLFYLVKSIKSSVIDPWWHTAEISTGITIKVPEARMAMAAATEEEAVAVAPTIHIEALFNGVSVKELASRVLYHYERLITSEVILSGHRGKVSDSINAINLTIGDPNSVQHTFDLVSSFDITVGLEDIVNRINMKSLNG